MDRIPALLEEFDNFKKIVAHAPVAPDEIHKSLNILQHALVRDIRSIYLLTSEISGSSKCLSRLD